MWFAPSGFTLEGYQRIFSDPTIIHGFLNSVFYTALATTISVTLIVTGGYALSRPDLPGRKTITFLLVVTLFFDGGMIPRYLVVQQLGSHPPPPPHLFVPPPNPRPPSSFRIHSVAKRCHPHS